MNEYICRFICLIGFIDCNIVVFLFNIVVVVFVGFFIGFLFFLVFVGYVIGILLFDVIVKWLKGFVLCYGFIIEWERSDVVWGKYDVFDMNVIFIRENWCGG